MTEGQSRATAIRCPPAAGRKNTELSAEAVQSRAWADAEAGPSGESADPGAERPARCGLCGKSKSLTRTECCGNWICDDEDSYELFSYARNSCARNHRRYTLCGSHYEEGHEGDWRDCADCRDAFETEMYVSYGTNEYNFDVLENPPEFEPTLCAACGTRIVLKAGGYSVKGDRYLCGNCTEREFPMPRGFGRR